MSNTTNFDDFKNVDASTATGASEAGVVLTDDFAKWRKKSNGVIEKVKALDTTVTNLDANAAIINKTSYQKFNKAIGSTVVNLTDPEEIDLAAGNTFVITLTQSVSNLSFINSGTATQGGRFTFIIKSTGTYSIAWPNSGTEEVIFADGSGALTLGTATDIMNVYNDGTKLYATLSAYIDQQITASQQGAADMHYLNVMHTAGFNDNDHTNSGLTGTEINNARILLGASVKDGHTVMVRFSQRYSYRWGNGTSYATRRAFQVFVNVGTYPNNYWVDQGAFI